MVTVGRPLDQAPEGVTHESRHSGSHAEESPEIRPDDFHSATARICWCRGSHHDCDLGHPAGDEDPLLPGICFQGKYDLLLRERQPAQVKLKELLQLLTGKEDGGRRRQNEMLL